jgi:hypothetical protein
LHTAIKHKGTQNHVWTLLIVNVVSEEIIIKTPNRNANDPKIYLTNVIHAFYSFGCTDGNGAVNWLLYAQAIKVPTKAAAYWTSQ